MEQVIKRERCDLLSNFVSLTSKSNFVERVASLSRVVICFQILYL